jgi:hypothetical protein
LPSDIVCSPVHFVADLPYGTSSRLAGGGSVSELIGALAAAFPASRMTFVTTRNAARALPDGVEITPCRGGRVVIRASGPISR